MTAALLQWNTSALFFTISYSLGDTDVLIGILGTCVFAISVHPSLQLIYVQRHVVLVAIVCPGT